MLDPRSKALFYILCYKKLSVTRFQVNRLYICNWKQNMYVNSCIRLMSKKRYIIEISVTFVVVKLSCEM